MATGPVKIVWLSLIGRFLGWVGHAVHACIRWDETAHPTHLPMPYAGAIVTAGGVPTCTRLQNAVVNTCPAYFEQCMDDVDIVASLTKFQDRLSCYCDLEKCLMIELEPPPHCQVK